MIGQRQLRPFALTLLSCVACLIMLAWPAGLCAQPDNRFRRILVLYWDNKDFPGNVRFEESFKAALQSQLAGGLEYYPEHLETTRFPGQDQTFFRDYLRQKYTGRTIDVVVATADVPLNFLIANRADLFPNAPIVFVANAPPGADKLSVEPGITGLVHQSTHRQTLELALKLHPNTKQVFVISGTREHDKRFEITARNELAGFENRVAITYLTDLPLNELVSKTSTLPPDSIVLYLWQQALNEQGKLLETFEVIGRIAPTSAAPIYGLGTTNLGQGIIGGYLTGATNNGRTVAEICTRILNGTPARDIPVAAAPSMPMFDARELKRWGISDDKLPAGSIVSFKQLTFWDQYKWLIVLIVAALLGETALIARLWFSQSKRRQAELETERFDQLARQSHRRLEEIISNVPGIVWEVAIDPQTKERRTTFISDYVRTIVGYTPDEWLAESPGFGMRIMLAEDRQRAMHGIETTMTTGKDTVCQYRCRAKNGRIVWLESYLSPVLNQGGEVEGLRGVTMDVTERKLGEEAVRKAEEKDLAILKAIPDLMFLQTREGVYLDLHYSNPENLFVPPNEYLGKNMREILPPELAEKFSRYFKRAAETHETQIIEYELTVKGEHRWYESRLVCCGENILSVVRDITESREAELALSESERRLRMAQEAARVGTWEWHVPTGRSVWSDMIWELLGLKPGDGPMHVDRFVEFIHPDDRERTLTRVNEVIAKGDYYYDEFRIVQSDGAVLWVSSQGRVLRGTDGAPQRMLGVNVDITKRKAAEERAHQTQQKDAAILNAIPDLMFLQSPDGVFLDYHANQEEDLFVPAAEFMGKNMREVLPVELAKKFFDSFARLEQDPEPQIVEYSLPFNGTEKWYECRIVRSGENFLSVVRDITEQRQALYEQRQSEEKFAKAFRANPQPMALSIMETGCYLDVNDSFLAISGYRRDEVIGRTSLELGVWDNPDARSNFVRQIEENGSVVNLETVLRAKDGFRHILLTSAEAVELGGERCLLVASTDITERKLVQEALQESEARFRNMADTAPVLIWMSDPKNLCIYVNQQWLDFTGRTMGQELGRGWTEGIHVEDFERCMAIYRAAYERRESFKLEYRLRRDDGEYRWMFDTGTPRFSPTGKFLGYIGSCLDITTRKETEQALFETHEQLIRAHAEVSRLKEELEAENIYLREELRSDQSVGEMIGESDAIKYVLFKVKHVAVTDSTVLITGETGTGKELVARAIHTSSLRNNRAFVTVNCATLPASLIESELFGHEKGAFTGATARKLGRFELANGGTIFLDEIGELPLESQVKLLRVLQEGEFERLGGAKAIKVDVRIIAATNRNLKEEIDKGAFREDLWYRLNVFPITVPPLRQRKEDIPLLVEHFVSHYAKKVGKTITSISPRTMQNLEDYAWPGNIRELANVVERAVIYTQGEVLHVVDLSESARKQAPTVIKSLEQIEREYIIHVLELTGWRIEGPRGVAKLLGLNPSTLRTRMIKLGIHKDTFTASR